MIQLRCVRHNFSHSQHGMSLSQILLLSHDFCYPSRILSTLQMSNLLRKVCSDPCYDVHISPYFIPSVKDSFLFPCKRMREPSSQAHYTKAFFDRGSNGVSCLGQAIQSPKREGVSESPTSAKYIVQLLFIRLGGRHSTRILLQLRVF